MPQVRAHDDLEAILSQVNTDDDEVVHDVTSAFDATFTWDYTKGARPALDKLYEKAKTSQWNGSTDLDWSTDVDPERTAVELAENDRRMQYVRALVDEPGSPVAKWGEKELVQYAMENLAHRASQFLHGEQGALLCTARIVETVPWIDAKYYASTQVVDEARHVEVFGRYLTEKMATSYPINADLRALIDDVLADSRWDITYLGMQIMIEGLALAAFGTMYRTTNEPLLRQLIRYVMSDEARHVAFGVLSLQEAYSGISGSELRERQEFVYEAALRMRDRFLHQEVWERLGVSARAMVPYFIRQNNEEEILFQRMLFAKIVPNCKKLGLLDGRDSWLRDRFTEMGVIEYEDHVDTSIEYSELNVIEADREAATAAARMNLSGARVVITGASRGIGEALASACAARGARVVLVARSHEQLAKLAADLGGEAFPADLSDATAIEPLVRRIEAGGPIDVLVNNAGLDLTGALTELPADKIAQLLDVNLLAPILLCRAVMPGMTARRHGHIVNMSSLASTNAVPGLVPYSASKAGLSHFTAGLRVELKGTGVTTTLVEIGTVRTPMLDSVTSHPPTVRALDRLARLQLSVDLDLEPVIDATVDAIEHERRHVRLPKRDVLFPMMAEAPRRLTEWLLAGVK